jgi:hypothetical protein
VGRCLHGIHGCPPRRSNELVTGIATRAGTRSSLRFRSETVYRGCVGVGVALLGACAGIVATKNTHLAEGLIVAVLLCLYVWYAISYPRGAVFSMFISLSLIPVYAVPSYRSFSPEPTAVAAVVVALALCKISGRVQVTMIDLAFTATCAIMVVAAWLGPHSLRATESELFLWIPPYIAGRAVCKRRNGPETFALAAAVAGLVALPFIVYETLSRHNLFFSLAWPNTQLTSLWAHAALRPGGLLRSQGAFGHPLSMALIIGSCAIFALALAVRSNSRVPRICWMLAAVALAVGQYTSHERSGWTVLIGGLLIFALAGIPRGKRTKQILLIALIVVPLSLLAVSASEPANDAGALERAGSTADRVDLWRHAFEPGALALVGLPETVNFNHFANAIRPGLVSIDSGFLQIGDVFGVIALIALFTVVAAVAGAAITARGTWAAVIPAVALADFAALTVIGFQTQLPVFIWLMVGGSSGVALRSARTGQGGRVQSAACADAQQQWMPRTSTYAASYLESGQLNGL